MSSIQLIGYSVTGVALYRAVAELTPVLAIATYTSPSAAWLTVGHVPAHIFSDGRSGIHPTVAHIRQMLAV